MLTAIALGSNLGDRRAHLDFACSRLAAFFNSLRTSSYHETDPVGVSSDHSKFLNAAAVGETSLKARDLLNALMAIEREGGRERPRELAPRTLDLDLIVFGDLIVNEPEMTIPHPRFRERRFVLEPLAEIAPAMRDPVTGKTVAELLKQLRT